MLPYIAYMDPMGMGISFQNRSSKLNISRLVLQLPKVQDHLSNIVWNPPCPVSHGHLEPSDPSPPAFFTRLACHGKTVAEAIRKTDGPRYRLADLRYDMKVGDVGSLADTVRTVHLKNGSSRIL